MNYKTISIAILAVGSLLSAEARVSSAQISGFLQDLTTRTEEIATAPVLQSNDIYVLEEYLNVMIIQNPEIREIARFKADGTVIKAAASNGYYVPDRNASAEPWFTAVCLTKAPYNNAIIDKQGTVLLFRAWPILDQTAGKKILGITYIKIDIKKFIQTVSDNSNDPLEVLYNGTPVLKRNWGEIHNFLEDSFTFSVADKFIIHYMDSHPEAPEPAAPTAAAQPLLGAPKETITTTPSPVESARTSTPAITALSEINRKTEIVSREAERNTTPQPPEAVVNSPNNEPAVADENKPQEQIPAAKTRSFTTNRVAETSNAATLQSWLSTDSILTSGYVGSSDKQILLFVLLVAGIGFVMIFIITTIMIRRIRRRHKEDKEREAMFKPDPVPTIMADKKETRLSDKEDTRLIEKIPAVRPGFSGEPLDETSHAERETRELPALREFIDDFLKKIHEVSLESNINQRNRVFEEINDDLNVWARSEIKQLSGRLGLLLQAIKECESKDGNSAELQVLRYEVMRIIKEVEDVEERLPQRNSVLIVS